MLPYFKTICFEKDNELRGNISLSAIGTDYHVQLKAILESLTKTICSNYKQAEAKFFVDNGPLVERELAVKAGLGFAGKNRNVITQAFGSFFFIGYILTNAVLPYSSNKNLGLSCGNCNLCIKACPGNALCEQAFNVERCASYLTQKKGELTDEQKRIMGNKIYGCDICQIVCPFNKAVIKNCKHTTIEITDIEQANPLLCNIKNMTNKQFKERFSNTALFWRGASVIRRNAQIAIENLTNQN